MISEEKYKIIFGKDVSFEKNTNVTVIIDKIKAVHTKYREELLEDLELGKEYTWEEVVEKFFKSIENSFGTSLVTRHFQKTALLTTNAENKWVHEFTIKIDADLNVTVYRKTQMRQNTHFHILCDY